MVSSVLFQSCSGCSESGKRATRRNTVNKLKNEKTKSNKINKSAVEKNMSHSTCDLSSLYEHTKKAVFMIYTTNGTKTFQGSGFFVSKAGIGISNYHVFESTTIGQELIKTCDGKIYKIEKVLEKSKEHDYIIFKIENGNNVDFLSITKTPSKVGSDVFAVGNPRGLEHTLSKGIISSYRMDNTLIQTTAEITHGSSGGPLFNMKGEVIGITTSGVGEANLNFAVNILQLKINRFI